MKFNRNNLDKAASPYLRQHQDNPVFWQEWNKATLDYAKLEGKPIFLSVGYSTCHWCHVMAREAFSDQAGADYLNKHFVTVKVDREDGREPVKESGPLSHNFQCREYDSKEALIVMAT